MVGSVANDGATNIGAADSMDGTLIRLKAQQKKEEAAKSERSKASIAQIEAAEGGYSKPAPEFKPTAETASGLMGLMSLVAAAGGILGGKGRTSGLMAINAASGMMEGYNKGRSELYEQQRQMFDEHMKSWEQNRKLVKEAFDRALRIAPTNLTLAQETLNRDLIALDLKPLAAINKTSGPMAAHATFRQVDSTLEEELKKYRQKLGPKATTSDLITEYEATKADERAKAAAENAALDRRKKLVETQLGEQKLFGGGLTPERQELKDIAEKLVKQNKPPTNEKEKIALDLYAPEGYKPTGPQYGPMAVFERAVPGSSEAFKTDIEKREVQADLQGIGTAANVVKEAQNPNIKFGEVPVLWENIKQKWRSNLGNMGLKDDGTLTFNTVLPTGQTLGDYLQEQIASTPVDPNDQNAVFQKDAAFAQLDIERTGRGGGVLPVGYIKTFGPMLDPKKYTKEAFTGVYQTRLKDLDRKLAGYGFNSDERNKIYTTYGNLIGQPILSIGKSSTAPALPSGLPENSQLIGKSTDGKSYVYQSPDGKKYAVPIEGQ